MTVIWAILKIIVILFLTAAGIFLAAVLAVLFVPVRYQAEGTYQGELKAAFRISWLLHLITVLAAVDDGFSCTIRAAGFRVYPRAVKKLRPGKRLKGQSAETPGQKNDTAVPPDAEGGAIEGSSAQVQEKAVHATAQNAPSAENPQSASAPETLENASSAEPDKMQRRRTGTRRKGFFDKLKTGFLEFCQKMVTVKENVTYYKKLLEQDASRRAIRHAWTQILRIIRHCLPRKVDVCFIVGTGNPASTGQIMAAQGLLYPWFQNKIRIVPDFEEKHLEGEFFIKGHVTACMLAICALRVVINKEVRQFIRLLRKKEEA